VDFEEREGREQRTEPVPLARTTVLVRLRHVLLLEDLLVVAHLASEIEHRGADAGPRGSVDEEVVVDRPVLREEREGIENRRVSVASRRIEGEKYVPCEEH
jgi:hypothetical protein